MHATLLAGIAAVFGALLRYGMIKLIDRYFGWTSLKISTIFINVSGAFLLGLFTNHLSPHSDQFILASGLMGGYTTFSTYMNETVQLQSRHPLTAFIYFIVTLIGGLIGASIGILI